MSTNSTASELLTWDRATLEDVASKVGTPFYIYSGEELRKRANEVLSIVEAEGAQARYAMKACSTRKILEELQSLGFWIDAVSGNEILRAVQAGFAPGQNPPTVLYSADVFRDNAIEAIKEHHALPNVGTPHMIDQLAEADYRGAIGIRINPGFGHGHVQQCDTGGPSSKHGIWYEDLEDSIARCKKYGFPIKLIHAHIGTGPAIGEFQTNIKRLVEYYSSIITSFDEVDAVNLGGGIPHPYREGDKRIDIAACRDLVSEAQKTLSEKAGRSIRIEIEPGRYVVAASATLVGRVCGLKDTRDNEKGPGQRFVTVDAGFCDLVRPTMYGSYHRIEVPGREGESLTPQVIAGPMCESGDVFTRDSDELLDPRPLPNLEIGDLLTIHDAGAYGFTMSSNYNSLGRVPQVWYDNGQAHLVSRRQVLEDLIREECDEPL